MQRRENTSLLPVPRPVQIPTKPLNYNLELNLKQYDLIVPGIAAPFQKNIVTQQNDTGPSRHPAALLSPAELRRQTDRHRLQSALVTSVSHLPVSGAEMAGGCSTAVAKEQEERNGEE